MNLYSKISKILKEIEDNKISFKNAIYKYTNNEGEKFFKTIYKLVIEVLKYKSIIISIIDTFFPDCANDKQYFMVLIYEKYFSSMKKKKIGGKLMKMLKDKEEEIINFIKENPVNIENYDKLQVEKMYFRINAQKDDYQELLIELAKHAVIQDEFIDNLFYINKKENSINMKQIFELRDNSKIIIQSKSSCLPAYILKKVTQMFSESYDIIDSCSAPGNKTLQLAEYFHDSKIHAFEINSERYKLLDQNVKKNNFFRNIIAINEDFLTSNPYDNKFKNVKLILADPSCSGSGTSHNSLIDSNDLNDICCKKIAGSYIENEQIDRLTQLAKFQIKILDHCMEFPNVEYISYSTCSIFMTENEYVVDKILKKHPEFKLLDIFFEINKINKYNLDFHKGITSNTEQTLRACRKCNNVDGFYVAIFTKIK